MQTQTTGLAVRQAVKGTVIDSGCADGDGLATPAVPSHSRRSSLTVCVCLSLLLLGDWSGRGLRAVAGDRPDPLTAAARQELRTRWEAEVASLSRQIEDQPGSVNLLSARGDAWFFLGDFAKAAGDFDQMVKLDPSLGDSHWRRGIACFYAGRYADAARQFEVYHSFDNIDRENGIWRYLSQFRAQGREQARKGLLKYEKDDREPFPDIYRMFGGMLEGTEVLERIKRDDLSDMEREKRLFYAELYVGLNAAVEGREEAAERHLAAAVANRWGARAGGGPGWMWQVGRLHHDQLRAARLKKESPAASQPSR